MRTQSLCHALEVVPDLLHVLPQPPFQELHLGEWVASVYGLVCEQM